MVNEAQDDTDTQDAAIALNRLERALERIGRSARSASPGYVAGAGPTDQIAARLDGLIAQLRNALADRDGKE